MNHADRSVRTVCFNTYQDRVDNDNERDGELKESVLTENFTNLLDSGHGTTVGRWVEMSVRVERVLSYNVCHRRSQSFSIALTLFELIDCKVCYGKNVLLLICRFDAVTEEEVFLGD